MNLMQLPDEQNSKRQDLKVESQRSSLNYLLISGMRPGEGSWLSFLGTTKRLETFTTKRLPTIPRIRRVIKRETEQICDCATARSCMWLINSSKEIPSKVQWFLGQWFKGHALLPMESSPLRIVYIYILGEDGMGMACFTLSHPEI